MSNEIPKHLGKPAAITTDLDNKDVHIKKLQAEILQLEIKNSELEREVIYLNNKVLNYMSTQLDLTHMINGGYDG
ncbi:hypothetical protein KAR91_79615 [Candidatus Pacearchaeota archaeon]|nr:hypothetical protein [Candidatus Pacearchaeota archaeon]